MGEGVWLVMVASIAGALLATGFTVHFEAQRRPNEEGKREKLEVNKKASYLWVTVCMLFFMASLGYFLGTWKPAPTRIEFFIWAALPLALISGIRCLHAYSDWAEKFAEGVWRDFSASYKPDPPTPPAGAHAGARADAAEAGGGGNKAHEGAPKPKPAAAHDGGQGVHKGGH
jgi:hypothetical protein